MKKVIFLFMALLICNAIKAQQTICKDIIERVKAIVAYEMNVISLRPNEKNDKEATKTFEDFKKSAFEQTTVNDVEKCLTDNYKNNKKLCEDIKKLNSKFTDVDAIVAYYSDSIFQQKGGAIEKFVKKRNKDDVTRLKKKIKERIQDITDSTNILFDSEEEISETPSEVKEKEQKNMKDSNSSRTDIVKDLCIDKHNDFAEILKKYIGYLLALVAIIITIILFKNNKNLANECNTLKEDKEKMDELLQEKNSEVQKCENTIDQLKQKNAELEKQNKELQEDVDNLEKARRKQIQQNSVATIGCATHEKKTIQNTPHEYYLGVPQDGKFAEGFEIYRPGKALYKVISNDGIYGEFEYINRPEAISYAKQSRTSFLESACNISGENKVDFVQIETRCKGKVERTSDGWKIIKKADVYLV